jgi:hypothetical protein
MFKTTVNDVVKNLRKTMKNLESLAIDKYSEAANYQILSDNAREEFRRAERIQKKLEELLS